MAEAPVDRRAFFRQGLRKFLGHAIETVGDRVVSALRTLGREQGLAAGTPALDVALTACVMCADMPCAAACPTDALDVPDEGWRGVRIARIAIDEERCITWHGSECAACATACPV